jgi:hypothetical protein
MRAISRITGVSINTVTKLSEDEMAAAAVRRASSVPSTRLARQRLSCLGTQCMQRKADSCVNLPPGSRFLGPLPPPTESAT